MLVKVEFDWSESVTMQKSFNHHKVSLEFPFSHFIVFWMVFQILICVRLVKLWKVIKEVSFCHCLGCPPPFLALVTWQSAAVQLSLKVQKAAALLSSHSPVPSLGLHPPAGLPSHASTSFSCSGTTPSPAKKHKHIDAVLLCETKQCKTKGKGTPCPSFG